MQSHWRGGNKGRGHGAFGRGRGNWRGSSASQQPVTPRPPSPSIGALLESVNRSSLSSDAVPVQAAAISDCKPLASFNWIGDEKAPTIILPGMPPVWKPLLKPIQLQEDAGEYFRDQNAARFPQHPVEPAVRALLLQQPGLNASDIDIFACGSTLGNVSRFVRGEHKPFRFTVEVVGSTAFFVRRENAPDERIVDVRGYGHAFPEAYTQWHADVKGSESHQRLIQYDFAGLKCIVRFEGDGYLEHLADSSAQNIPPKIPEIIGLRMQEGGHAIPQQAIFDLKTRSVMRKDVDVLSQELPRLWITQIPTFVLAFHTRGIFHGEDMSVRDVRKEVADWERANRDDLRKLGGLLHWLIDLVKDSPDGKCEVRCRDAGVLEIRTQLDDAPTAMSTEVREIWANGSPSSPPESEDEGALHGAPLAPSDEEASGDDDDLAAFSDEEWEKDFTACSDACGYCGRC